MKQVLLLFAYFKLLDYGIIGEGIETCDGGGKISLTEDEVSFLQVGSSLAKRGTLSGSSSSVSRAEASKALHTLAEKTLQERALDLGIALHRQLQSVPEFDAAEFPVLVAGGRELLESEADRLHPSRGAQLLRDFATHTPSILMMAAPSNSREVHEKEHTIAAPVDIADVLDFPEAPVLPWVSGALPPYVWGQGSDWQKHIADVLNPWAQIQGRNEKDAKKDNGKLSMEEIKAIKALVHMFVGGVHSDEASEERGKRDSEQKHEVQNEVMAKKEQGMSSHEVSDEQKVSPAGNGVITEHVHIVRDPHQVKQNSGNESVEEKHGRRYTTRNDDNAAAKNQESGKAHDGANVTTEITSHMASEETFTHTDPRGHTVTSTVKCKDGQCNTTKTTGDNVKGGFVKKSHLTKSFNTSGIAIIPNTPVRAQYSIRKAAKEMQSMTTKAQGQLRSAAEEMAHAMEVIKQHFGEHKLKGVVDSLVNSPAVRAGRGTKPEPVLPSASGLMKTSLESDKTQAESDGQGKLVTRREICKDGKCWAELSSTSSDGSDKGANRRTEMNFQEHPTTVNNYNENFYIDILDDSQRSSDGGQVYGRGDGVWAGKVTNDFPLGGYGDGDGDGDDDEKSDAGIQQDKGSGDGDGDDDEKSDAGIPQDTGSGDEGNSDTHNNGNETKHTRTSIKLPSLGKLSGMISHIKTDLKTAGLENRLLKAFQNKAHGENDETSGDNDGSDQDISKDDGSSDDESGVGETGSDADNVMIHMPAKSHEQEDSSITKTEEKDQGHATERSGLQLDDRSGSSETIEDDHDSNGERDDTPKPTSTDKSGEDEVRRQARSSSPIKKSGLSLKLPSAV
jgi:hypothetical protein